MACTGWAPTRSASGGSRSESHPLRGVVARPARPVSAVLTQKLFGWHPVQPGLIADLGEGHYFTRS
jgi:hypothetical protein